MRYLLPLIALCTPLSAQNLPANMVCEGSSPDWSLSISGETAVFDFQRTSDLALMLTTPAQGRDWPVALTFVGRGDSAIVMVDEGKCGGETFEASVLTQRGETPLLLVGCCYSDR